MVNFAVSLETSPKRSWRTETLGGRETGKNEVRHMAGFKTNAEKKKKTNAELSPSSTDTWFDHMEIYVQ